MRPSKQLRYHLYCRTSCTVQAPILSNSPDAAASHTRARAHTRQIFEHAQLNLNQQLLKARGERTRNADVAGERVVHKLEHAAPASNRFHTDATAEAAARRAALGGTTCRTLRAAAAAAAGRSPRRRAAAAQPVAGIGRRTVQCSAEKRAREEERDSPCHSPDSRHNIPKILLTKEGSLCRQRERSFTPDGRRRLRSPAPRQAGAHRRLQAKRRSVRGCCAVIGTAFATGFPYQHAVRRIIRAAPSMMRALTWKSGS